VLPSIGGLLQATLKQKEAELELVAPYSRSYGRTLIRTILESEGGGVALVSSFTVLGRVSNAAACSALCLSKLFGWQTIASLAGERMSARPGHSQWAQL
jgi:hypothetical protein